MKKTYYFLFSLLCMIFSCVVFAKNEIFVESMIPVYDENSGVIVTEEDGMHNVIFNDKNQKVEYNIVIKNNTDEDISTDNIVLPEPKEDFLKYEIKGDNILEANSSSDLILSLETIETEGWGRNFNMFIGDQLIVSNPNTEVREIILALLFATCVTSISIVFVKQKKIQKFVVTGVMLVSIINIVNASNPWLLPIKLNVSFESQNVMKQSYVTNDDEIEKVDYWGYADKIKNIYIQNEFYEIDEYFKKFDVSQKHNERVLAYLVINEEDTEFYDLYIQADGLIYMNSDASMYFESMYYLDKIENLKGFETDNIVNMSKMFSGTGYDSNVFTLDVSSFDTSNVTNMSYMFYNTGVNNPTFSLDVSNFNTSKVIDMSYMFAGAGYNSALFTLDVSNFDTSKVTDMQYMFYQSGYSSPIYTLDVSNFDTSNVTSMYSMFCHAGFKNEKFLLDVSSFDTSKVTDMAYMFAYMGYNADDFVLDLSNFDTNNVTDMKYMFSNTARNSKSILLNIGGFNTGKVVNMKNMFEGFGVNVSSFHLDVSNFDTSNVTNMYQMFYETGSYSPDFKLTLGDKFNTSKVTDMAYMFGSTGLTSNNFMLDISNFDTSNVTNMTRMFYKTGYSNPNFTLDLTGFDFTKVTNISMFLYQTGYNSTAFNTKLNINFPNLSSVNTSSMLKEVAMQSGSSVKLDYTSRTSLFVDELISQNNKSNLVKGNVTKFYIDEVMFQDEIQLNNEKFYVIDSDETTVTLFPLYALDSDGKQNKDAALVPFAKSNGWEYEPGPMEIDSSYYSDELKELINKYSIYLKEVTGDNNVYVDLWTLEELGYIGCSIYDDYYYELDEYFHCADRSWFPLSSIWWTRSAVSNYDNSVWSVSNNQLRVDSYHLTGAVRPKIIVSKKELKEVVNKQLQPK